MIHEETLTGIKLVEIFWRREIENKKKKRRKKRRGRRKIFRNSILLQKVNLSFQFSEKRSCFDQNCRWQSTLFICEPLQSTLFQVLTRTVAYKFVRFCCGGGGGGGFVWLVDCFCLFCILTNCFCFFLHFD